MNLRAICFALAVSLFVAGSLAAAPVLQTYQQGDTSGYSGTEDTFLWLNQPATDQSSLGVIHFNGGAGPDIGHGLLRFSGIFGNGTGQVPVGSTIDEAELVLTVQNAGGTVNLHRLLMPFAESDTWNGSFGGNGVQADDIEAALTATASFGTPISPPAVTLDVTADVAAWAADPSQHYGWALLQANNNAGNFFSSEDGTLANRPFLSITFVAPPPALTPEPGTLVLLVAAGAMAAVAMGVRRRRYLNSFVR